MFAAELDAATRALEEAEVRLAEAPEPAEGQLGMVQREPGAQA